MMALENLYEHYLRSRSLSIDTRSIQEGDLFFALRGDNFDGNLFVRQALNAGAALCVTESAEFAGEERCLVVPDALKCLQQLANYHRRKHRIPVIGITGTNGKTTTKELCRTVLSTIFQCVATIGNLNNHIGVPLTLLRIRQKTEFVVVELGANHPGEIAELCAIAEPTHGIITNIGKAHLEGFGSFEHVINAKKELYDYLRKTKGKVFLNADDPLLVSLAEGLDTITYGEDPSATFCGQISGSDPYLRIDLGNKIIDTHLIGSYNFPNIMAALAVSSHFGVDVERARSAIFQYQVDNHRSQLIKTEKNCLILDCYNANPTSMKIALENFFSADFPQKVLILGEMKELGKYTQEEHQKIIDLILEPQLEHVFLVGNGFASFVDKPVRWFPSITELKNHLTENIINNSTILVKGSRGIKLEEVRDVL